MLFHCAIKNDSVQEFDDLVAKGENIEIANKAGQSALFWAVVGSEVSQIDTPKSKIDPVKRDKFITKLLDAGADINTKNVREKTLLHAAVLSDFKTLKKIITADVDVNQRSNDSYYHLGSKPNKRWVYPLYVAVTTNDLEKVRVLIKACLLYTSPSPRDS